MLIHILSTFVHKLYMYYKLKYIFSYVTWIIFGNLWIPEWPILIDLPIIYTLTVAVTLLNYIQALFIYLKYVYLATITQI